MCHDFKVVAQFISVNLSHQCHRCSIFLQTRLGKAGVVEKKYKTGEILSPLGQFVRRLCDGEGVSSTELGWSRRLQQREFKI